VDAIWDYFLLKLMERNGKLYGKDYDRQWAIALETTWPEVEQIYEGSVPLSSCFITPSWISCCFMSRVAYFSKFQWLILPP
jgi:hypothetical protein